MEQLFQSYLALLKDLGGNLDRLSQLAQEKDSVVRQDDLIALDEVLKQEQVLTLSLRGLEQKRAKLTTQLGLEGLPLSKVASRFPPALAKQAAQTADDLLQRYSIYRSYADMARATLELNLHQIEKTIAAAGVDPKLAVAGYESPNVEPPQSMKTDFRA